MLIDNIFRGVRSRHYKRFHGDKMLNKTQSNQKTYQEELIEKLIAENTTIKLGFDNLKKEYAILRKKYDALCEEVPREVVEQIN